MIYLKSSFAGLGALVAYCVLFAMFGVRLLLPAPPVPKWTDLPEGISFVSNSRWVPIPLWGPLAILRSDCSFLLARTVQRGQPQRSQRRTSRRKTGC